MRRIAIVGAGLIGRAWAVVFARAGCAVALHDRDPRALEIQFAQIADTLEDLRRYELLTESPDAVLARVRPEPALGRALGDVELAQESVDETVPAKREIFAEMDRLAPAQAILASSTSWIRASAFTAGLAGRYRCLVAHPVNPPHLVPLVELAPAPWTSPEVVARARALYESAGQVPVTLDREIEGFVLNRLQGAVLDEAFKLYAEGYMSAEDIDRVMRDGLSLRWSFMGPFETIDLNAPGGVADYARRYGSTYRRIAAERTSFDWDPAVVRRLENERRQQLPATELDRRQRWRDRRLMALVAHRRRQSDD